MTMAYKGFNQNLQGFKGFQYNVGEIYNLDGELKICENGFHYCKRIIDIDNYYDLQDSRICEVEIVGKEFTDHYGKFVTDKIKIVRELSKKEINKYFKDNWKKLIKDGDYWTKMAVVRQGFGLDELVKDEDWEVRKEIAKLGREKYLDILVKDDFYQVRLAVVKHGRKQDLDILVKDEHWRVRIEVARKGRPEDLDILVKDENWEVRCAVTKYRR